MRTDERNAIIRIVKLAQIRDDELLNSTIFGKRFLDRIDEIKKHGDADCKCILCSANPARNGIVCDTCMEELGQVEEEENRYCRNCGAVMSASASSCHRCGFGQDDGFNYCGCCGSKVPSPLYQDVELEFEEELSDSKTPNVVAQDICKRLGNGFVIRKSDNREDVFFDYDFFELANEEKKFCRLEVESFKGKTVQISVESDDDVIMTRGAKILIRMMEPELSDFEINDIFVAAKERQSVYYYNGIYYDLEADKFIAGTEVYSDEIGANVDASINPFSPEGQDVGDLLGGYQQDIEEMLKDGAIKAEINDNRVFSVELCQPSSLNGIGIAYGMTEQRALEKMRESCSNIYLDPERGRNDKYSYKGQVIIDGRYAQIVVAILCGHVRSLSITLENM